MTYSLRHIHRGLTHLCPERRVDGGDHREPAGGGGGRTHSRELPRTDLGADLVISAKGVDEPVKLRYLFRKPWKGNLYNEFALPLGAFEVEK